MHKKIIIISVASLLVFFLLVLADLIPFWMPMMGEMLALLFVTLCLLVWVGLVLTENTSDEREVLIASQSGRVAYVAGLMCLLCALIIQGLAHTIDPWIPVTLAVMVGSKVASRLYLE